MSNVGVPSTPCSSAKEEPAYILITSLLGSIFSSKSERYCVYIDYVIARLYF